MYPSISYAPLFILFENILLYAQGLICAGGCTLWEIGVSFFGLNFHQQTLTLQQDKKQTCQLKYISLCGREQGLGEGGASCR